MSNQSALLRANLPVSDSSGTWYQKAKITDASSDKQILVNSKSQQASVTSKGDEIRNSLFHYQCRCRQCQDFDSAKLSKKRTPYSSYAEVLSASVKIEVHNTDKDLKNAMKSEFIKDDRVLKGGGKKGELSQIFIDTIQVAKDHGINLKPDTPNAASGNCLFESTVDNVNHRPECFPKS